MERDSAYFKVILPKKISLNKIYAGVHWATRQKLADIFHSEFLDKKSLKITEYPVEILYDFYFLKQPLDTLNCAYMAKMLEDGMVRNGILKGDEPNYVTSSTLMSQKSKKYPNDTVIIRIIAKDEK